MPARTARLVVVDSRTGLAVAEPIAIEVVRIRPEYESARVILGVALGLALLTIAWALLRNTDWREPVAAIPWTD